MSTPSTSHARQQHVLGQPNDLLKVIVVINNILANNDDWPQVVSKLELKRWFINKVTEVFDGTGEKAIDECIDIAIDYGFIKTQMNESTKQFRYLTRSHEELKTTHDWFCFDCDILVDKRSSLFLKCLLCFRVFHRKCVNYDDSADYICPFCKRIEEWEADGCVGKQKVSQDRVNRLIGFLLSFVKSKMKNKVKKLDLNVNNNSKLIMFKKMDLTVMANKANDNKYKSLSKLEDDFFIFMHNLHITSIDFENTDIYTNFADLRVYLVKELEQMRYCVDCYERSNDKELRETDPLWFCIPCVPPHKVVFVKSKGFPFSPAKVININEEKRTLSVRYFDKEYRRADNVKESQIELTTNKAIRDQLENNKNMNKSLELLKKYEELHKNVLITQNIFTTISKPEVNELSGIEDSIESVVKQSGRKRGRKPKPKLNKPTVNRNCFNSEKNILQKKFIDFSDSSNSLSPKQSQVMPSSHTPTQVNCSDNSLLQTPVTSDKRRSGRIITKKIDKENIKNEEKTIEQTNGSNEQMENNINSEIENKIDVIEEEEEDMEIDVITNNVTEIVDPKPAIDEIETVDSSEMIVHNLTAINLNNNMSPNEIKTDVQSNSQQNNDERIDKLLTDFDNSGEEFKTKMTDIMSMTEGSDERIDPKTLKEKLIVLNYYWDKQLELSKKVINDLKSQLIDSKTRDWCVVCRKEALYYCCHRKYCSKECQTKDWIIHYKYCDN
ncbi:zinc finger MYND domain-containing protein 11-like [Oppia nitens]|uniref:zinc finger MYND domain-containing protein 11-like n=1 Tax=Oppia nitens TaxID=1686743 RepID=UPI0023DC98F9|nr:zinc finger MYND domain-containing protein 11-like [Oppia nitens]